MVGRGTDVGGRPGLSHISRACRRQRGHVDRRARALPDTREPAPPRPAPPHTAPRRAAPRRPAAHRLVAPRHGRARSPARACQVRGLGASVTSLFALLGAVPASAWVNSEQPAWRRAAGISIATGLAAAFAASLCAPSTPTRLATPPPPNPSTRCKHAPPRRSMPASQPRPTVCHPLRAPHRRPETAGVALQGASPDLTPRGIRRRPSAEHRRRRPSTSIMYGSPEQT